MNVYLDMDGVVANFHGAVLAAHDRLDLCEDNWRTYPLGEFVDHVLGFESREAFWVKTYRLCPNFWRTVGPMPWFPSIMDGIRLFMERGDEIYFLSRPHHNPDSLAAKVEFLHRYLGADFNKYVFTWNKELLANPRAVLVDDEAEQVDTFRRFGGKAIIFAQPWNGNGGFTDEQRLQRFYQQLEAVLSNR